MKKANVIELNPTSFDPDVRNLTDSSLTGTHNTNKQTQNRPKTYIQKLFAANPARKTHIHITLPTQSLWKLTDPPPSRPRRIISKGFSLKTTTFCTIL